MEISLRRPAVSQSMESIGAHSQLQRKLNRCIDKISSKEVRSIRRSYALLPNVRAKNSPEIMRWVLSFINRGVCCENLKEFYYALKKCIFARITKSWGVRFECNIEKKRGAESIRFQRPLQNTSDKGYPLLPISKKVLLIHERLIRLNIHQKGLLADNNKGWTWKKTESWNKATPCCDVKKTRDSVTIWSLMRLPLKRTRVNLQWNGYCERYVENFQGSKKARFRVRESERERQDECCAVYDDGMAHHRRNPRRVYLTLDGPALANIWVSEISVKGLPEKNRPKHPYLFFLLMVKCYPYIRRCAPHVVVLAKRVEIEGTRVGVQVLLVENEGENRYWFLLRANHLPWWHGIHCC